MIRVLLVIDGLRFGGAENVLATLAAYAGRAGIAPRVAVLSPPDRGRDRWLPVLRRAGLEPRFLGIDRLSRPDGIVRVAAAIRASRCDVVHAHLEDAATLVPPAAVLAARPAVCTLHHVPGPLPGRRAALRERLAVRIASHSRGLIFVSEASRRGFAARYGEDPRTWTVLPNGVDLDRYRPAFRPGVRDRFGLPADAPVVAVVGHVRPGKGHDVAVAAWPYVLARHPDARLLAVGDGPGLPALRRDVARLGLGGRVVLAGACDDMPDVLRACDLVLLPSRTEALPTVLAEAAACGVPAVATRVGGVPEVVAEGVTGWLFEPPPNPRDAAATVAHALDVRLGDPGRYAAMGAAARSLARERFDARVWAEHLAGAYRDAAAGRRLGGRTFVPGVGAAT